MMFKKGKKPTWKDTLDSQKNRDWGHVDNVVEAAKLIMYPCFEWNGRIYEFENGIRRDTGWTAEELDD